MVGEKSELLDSTVEAGERDPSDPVEGREESGYGAVGGKDVRDIGPEKRVNETPAGSEAVARGAADGVDDLSSSY